MVRNMMKFSLVLPMVFAWTSPVLGDSLTDSGKEKLNNVLIGILGDSEAAAADLRYTVASTKTVNNVELLKIAGEDFLALVDSNGTVFDFEPSLSSFADEDEVAKTLTHEHALSREAALDVFARTAKIFGLEIDEEKCSARFWDLGEASGKMRIEGIDRDLFSAAWYMRYEFVYNGVRCRERYLSVAVSAFSGKVKGIFYEPLVIPGELEEKITPEAAVKAVAAWLQDEPYFARTRFLKDGIEKVIACPNPFPNARHKFEESITAPTSYYCWEVRFEYEENKRWFGAAAWVNVQTGEVIGGGVLPLQQEE